jgi:threonine synthase
VGWRGKILARSALFHVRGDTDPVSEPFSGAKVNYLSTRGEAPPLSFTDALIAGLAPDGGLYLPDAYPCFSAATIAGFAGRPYTEVAEAVMAPFVAGSIAPEALRTMLAGAYARFDHAVIAPLSQIGDNLFLLELFHGPTLAFKDLAMQLLARLMDHVLKAHGQKAVIIGATSGDTGAAAIEAFAGLEQADVFILYPHQRVSDVQRRQMTTLEAANIHVIALEGTFDDAQAIVKGLFNHKSFRDEFALAGVNSINWARVAAQIVYYFTSAVALGAPHRAVSFAVPTGNFGDILAGWIAKQMGLSIERLVIATNENDILARTLETGRYELRPVAATQSPSMDIQISSNFERLLYEVHGRDGAGVRRLMGALQQSGSFSLDPTPLAAIRRDFDALRIGEAATTEEIARVFRETGRLIDPHTAVGVGAGRRALNTHPDVPMIVLGTAHPAKFPQAVEKATGISAPLPMHLADIFERKEHFDVLPNDQARIEAFLRECMRGQRRAAS